MLSYTLPVLTKTQDDLAAFHARVLGSSCASTESAPAVLNTHEEVVLDVEDDGLGYYPDGNKRTLTDDQIAMFRHSEIYAILRQRQIRQENKEADGSEDSNNEGGESELGDVTPAAPAYTTTAGEVIFERKNGGYLSIESEDEDDAAFHSEDKAPIATLPDPNATSESKAPHNGDRSTLPETHQQDRDTNGLLRKRKRDSPDLDITPDDPYTARRFARELDSAASESQVLDY